VSPRTARTTQRNPVSKNLRKKKKQKTKTKTKTKKKKQKKREGKKKKKEKEKIPESCDSFLASVNLICSQLTATISHHHRVPQETASSEALLIKLVFLTMQTRHTLCYIVFKPRSVSSPK
jgi:seryl-tRNA synthetase